MTEPAQEGFTLVEMLVALTIMALISLMSWRGLDAVLHADEQLSRQARQTQALFNVLSQMGRDLELHLPPCCLPKTRAQRRRSCRPVSAGRLRARGRPS